MNFFKDILCEAELIEMQLKKDRPASHISGWAWLIWNPELHVHFGAEFSPSVLMHVASATHSSSLPAMMHVLPGTKSPTARKCICNQLLRCFDEGAHTTIQSNHFPF